MEEIWRDITGYEGIYQVSNFGRVRSLDNRPSVPGGSASKRKGRELYLKHRSDGRVSVTLSKDGKRHYCLVHHLVARAFIGDSPGPVGRGRDNYHVDHKDGNPANNRVENLEWCTNIENVRRDHARRLSFFHGDLSSENNLSELDLVALVALARTERFDVEQLARLFAVEQSIVEEVLTTSAADFFKKNSRRSKLGVDTWDQGAIS